MCGMREWKKIGVIEQGGSTLEEEIMEKEADEGRTSVGMGGGG